MMYKKLWAITFVIAIALVGLCVLGLYSISLHARGLEGSRLAEFAAVADQIRRDVIRKLDMFISTEDARAYTDYQYAYIPEGLNRVPAVVRSPLAESVSNGMAYGYFQIEPDGSVITPYFQAGRLSQADAEIKTYITHLNDTLIRQLHPNGFAKSENLDQQVAKKLDMNLINTLQDNLDKKLLEQKGANTKENAGGKISQSKTSLNRSSYRIQSRGREPLPRYESQTRANTYENEMIANNPAQQLMQDDYSRMYGEGYNSQATRNDNYSRADNSGSAAAQQQVEENISAQSPTRSGFGRSYESRSVDEVKDKLTQSESEQMPQQAQAVDTVQVRIEPFTSVVVPDPDCQSFFGGQVYWLRHIQIEDKHFIQGFQLDQEKLVKEVNESAARLIRKGMDFSIISETDPEPAGTRHAAVMKFDFGSLVLSLMELDPSWVASQVARLRNWYLAIITVVALATLLALISLWRNFLAQQRLSRKKDDFMSAVSHELRTPLTTIRMYTEMLENNWIRTDEKRGEYYRTMRQESERLSRLIENVLDFSRIQRGRKKYEFKLGDINRSVSEVIDMMAPCAQRAGFELKRDLGDVGSFAFDSDAVMQITINLIDNALKYAKQADDKVITVRTRSNNSYVIIEVEDHGPGIPRTQRTKVFDEFYRLGEESVRETTGTGLGLALVKRFAQAHNGFVEVLGARPSGAILRVGLMTK